MGRFRVRVNGAEKPVRATTVSAVPFNRVWPGHQRSIDQTEEAYYVTFDFSEQATIEIDVSDEIKTLEIRPLAFQIPHRVEGNTIVIELSKPMHFTVEVNGYHHCLHVFSNPIFRYERDEKTIYFGPGEHYAGLISPASGDTIVIDEGAVVYGTIFANQVENVKIIGRGTLNSSLYKRGDDASMKTDGGAEIATALSEMGFSEKDISYTGSVVFYGCKNIYMEGVVLEDSMFWAFITRNACENIVIDNIKIVGQWRYNADGVDICNSKNVVLKNSFIRSFDDCLVIRGAHMEGEEGNIENCVVENCVMWCDWGKSLEIWCGYKKTTVDSIIFRNNYLMRISAVAIDITTWFGSAETIVRNVLYDHIYVESDSSVTALVMQDSDEQTYSIPAEKHAPVLVRIDGERLGVSTGNQGVRPVEDLSIFSLQYSNIVLKDIYCGTEKYPVQIHADNDAITIDNVTMTNVEASELIVKGNVKNISIIE